MNILEIDAGNTRIKWRLIEYKKQQKKKIHSGDALAQNLIDELPQDFCRQLLELTNKNIKKISVSNVRDVGFANALSSFCEKHFSVSVNFALVSSEHAGLTNAYQNFETLGVDRWLAMLAAWDSAKSAICIVDCGSAITIDLISAEGQHEGGYIVPGLQTMQRSLGDQTVNLTYQPESISNLEPGKNTVDAINHGVLNMVLGMLEKVDQKRRTDKAVDRSWYLCGGDAATLSKFIKWEHEVKPELVMDGLVIACVYSEDGDQVK
ncbi:MAG: type III pantothenate kinase [Gammaproteobacteria bacterium]|jgi:type III pantothenate kinase|nr:type III pantothenate kinase [Gammaproteobacteria bacterium]